MWHYEFWGTPGKSKGTTDRLTSWKLSSSEQLLFTRGSKARSLVKITKKSSQQTYSGDWINQRTFEENAGEKMKKKHICISFPLVFCMYELNNRCLEENQRYLP